MFDYFQAPDWVANSSDPKAALISIHRNTAAYLSVVVPWYGCAMEIRCIVPNGTKSGARNHLFDQSALGILMNVTGRSGSS